MKTALIVFVSSTGSSRLKNLASKAGLLSVQITQTPSAIKTDGCSYSLRVGSDILRDVLSIAKSHRITFSSVFLEEYDISGSIIYKQIL